MTRAWTLVVLSALLAARPSVQAPGGRVSIADPAPGVQSSKAPGTGVTPARVIELPDVDEIESTAFLPDGRHVVVHAHSRAINVWELIHHYWPEEIGFILVVAAIVLVRMTIHVMLHPQRRGEPYCRKCGYCLSGVPPGPCPECGLDKRTTGGDRGRLVGRPMARRLRWPITAVAVLGIVYGGLFAAGVGRWSSLFDAFSWWSRGLLDLARRLDQPWLIARSEPVERLFIIDTSTGRTGRELLLRAAKHDAKHRVILFRDSTYVVSDNGERIEHRDSEHDATLQALSTSTPPLCGVVSLFAVVGPCAGGRIALTPIVADPAEVNGPNPVFLWDLKARRVDPISRDELARIRIADSEVLPPFIRALLLVAASFENRSVRGVDAGHDRVAVLTAPDGPGPGSLRVYDLAGSRPNGPLLSMTLDAGARNVRVAPTGARLIIEDDTFRTVAGAAVPTGGSLVHRIVVYELPPVLARDGGG